MILKGKKILLRPVNSIDYKDVYEWFNNRDILDKLIGFRPEFSSEMATEWCNSAQKSGNAIKWMIENLDKPGKAIGFVGLYNIDYVNKNAESAIIIGSKEERGKGFGYEALKLKCEFAFDYLGLKLIYSYILTDNISSVKVYEKVGFIREGILRSRVYRSGSWHDLFVMSLMKEEDNY